MSTSTDIIYILIVGILLMLLVWSAIYLGLFRKKSKHIITNQRNEAAFQRELAISRIEIKEQILDHIGYELHEDVGQKLSVARLLTSKTATQCSAESSANAKEINLIIGECIQDIRDLSAVFIRRKSGDEGFVELVESEVFRLQRLGNSEVNYTINNRNLVINENNSVILFRIVQQTLNLVLRHTKMKSMDFVVKDSTEFVQINIKFDGADYAKFKSANEAEFIRMRSRANIINATIKVSSLKEAIDISINYYKNGKN